MKGGEVLGPGRLTKCRSRDSNGRIVFRPKIRIHVANRLIARFPNTLPPEANSHLFRSLSEGCNSFLHV